MLTLVAFEPGTKIGQLIMDDTKEWLLIQSSDIFMEPNSCVKLCHVGKHACISRKQQGKTRGLVPLRF
jgi:hypothetical protein